MFRGRHGLIGIGVHRAGFWDSGHVQRVDRTYRFNVRVVLGRVLGAGCGRVCVSLSCLAMSGWSSTHLEGPAVGVPLLPCVGARAQKTRCEGEERG